MAAVGRISGPLLKANLERQGVPLAFETDLLYLNVVDSHIGINTATPQYDLDVNGTTRTTNLEVTSYANIADITVSGNTISTTNSILNLATDNTVVYQQRLNVDSIDIHENVIETVDSNSNLELRANGTGLIYIPDNNVLINQDLTVSGNTTLSSVIASGTITSESFYNGNILVDDNFITTTDTNSDLELRANGTGVIYVPSNNVLIDQNLEVAGTTTLADTNITGTLSLTGDLNQTGNVDITGNITVSNTLTVDNTAQFENIRIDQNKIETTISNSNLELRPAGSGTVEIFSDTTVYGNIHATGNITADGNIEIGDSTTDSVTFNAEIASDIIPDADNTYQLGSVDKRWANIWVDTFVADSIDTGALVVDGIDMALRQGNIIYVAENGSTTNTGTHPNDPKSSVKEALQLASAGDTVYIYPGVFIEEFPLEVPAGVTLTGVSIRSVEIRPTNETRYNDAFLLNGESTVENITIKDFYSGGNLYEVTDSSAGSVTVNVGISDYAHTYVSGGTINISGTDFVVTGATYDETTGELVVTHGGATATIGSTIFLSNITFSCGASDTRVFPDNGYAFKFKKDFVVTTRSPYVRNISVITQGSVTTTSDPRGFDSGDAGKGAYLDGASAAANSREASALFHSVTFITPGVDAITMTNGVRVEWLNSFTYFANKGLYAKDSGYGLKSTGKTQVRVSGVTGSFAAGETISYYDFDGVTLLGQGTIDSVDGDKLLLTGKVEGLATAADRGGKTITANGDAQLSTAEKKFGSASLALDGTGDYASITAQDDFGFGTGNFTVEGWIYLTDLVGTQQVFDFRAGAVGDIAATVYVSNGGQIRYYTDSADRITGISLSSTTWYHVALVKESGSTKLYIDGTQVGSTYTDVNNYGTTKPLTIGSRYDGGNEFGGYIDEVRVIKGAAEYTGNFTPSTSRLTVTENTVLMARFDGDNASTTFNDDVIYTQDIRFSGGATASGFTLVDYTDFGAELRSIASACVYGNYGAYGDGAGVIMYLISQNFAYIGTGKDVTNDTNLVIQANEVVEFNDAKIRFSSVDHQGDFRVGDLFYVNQSTGTVEFTAAEFNVASDTGLTFSNGGDVTFIDGTKVETGNLRISGNTVESLSGDVNIVSASNEINLQNDVNIDGNLDVTGNVTIGGNITIGDEATDSISIVAGIDSDLIPRQPATYNLGSETNEWNKLFVSELNIDSIKINTNVIETIESNADLELRANGTGEILVPNNNVQIDNNLTVSGDTDLQGTTVTGTITHTGDFDQVGNTNVVGDVFVSQDLDVTGAAQFEEILIDDNFVTTTSSNADLELRAAGTGRIYVPVNNVEINNDLTVNGVAYLNDINSTGTITANSFSTGDILIDDNYITTTVSNSNLELRTNGTGAVLIDNFSFNTNIISTDTNMVLTPSSGIVEIDSTASLRVPRGTVAERPASPELGMIRFNIDDNTFEGYDGNWRALSRGVIDLDRNTFITAELTPGANDNIIRFYSNNTVVADIDYDRLRADKLIVDDVQIDGNVISTINSNSDLELRPNGTGSVVTDNFAIKDNTITNTVSNSITQFVATDNGYFKFTGNKGVVLPVGGNLDRPLPAFTETGMTRFNTDDDRLEIFDGSSWVSVAGTSGAISSVDAEELAIAFVLTLG